ncbi:MAG TPA: hypothetical protein PLK04_10345 [Bacillota bacterium]|nr:hypothetical protein [Bacillota bacterium]
MGSAYVKSRGDLYLFLRNRLKKLLPSGFKALLKRADPIHLAWNKDEPKTWPADPAGGGVGFDRYEYSLFSQNGEDGILRYLFSEIGFGSRQFLEFGFEGTENNSLRLVLKENFSGLFIDGSKLCVDQFNKAARASGVTRARALCAFLTVDNLEETLFDAGVPSDLDLLSIDVDGVDYWLWDSLTYVSPRIVVIEYNASFGPQRSITVPYEPDFDRVEKHPSTFYHGASLSALVKLGMKKGYSLVGCDSNGVNAFFVRDDLIKAPLGAVSPETAYRLHRSRLDRGISPEAQFDAVKGLPFVEVV